MSTTYLRGTNLQGYASPTGYRLQPAQSGVGSLSYLHHGAPTRTQQQTTYVPSAPRAPTTAQQREDAVSQALNQQAHAVGRIGTGLPANVNVHNVRHGWMSNLNPEMYGGVARVDVDGQHVRLPNALLQQMMFTDAWNQGRSNMMGEYFGGRGVAPDPSVYRYSDVGADVGRLNRLTEQNPQFTREGAFNPFVRAQEGAIGASQRYNQLMGQMQNTTELRDASGRMEGQGKMDALRRQAEEAKRERDMYNSDMNRAQARRRGAEEGGALSRAMHDVFKQGISRTYSNLPIKETYIR